MSQSKWTAKVGHPQVYSPFRSNHPPHAVLSRGFEGDREHIIGEEGLWLVSFSGNMAWKQGFGGRLTLATYYQLAQFILKISFALAKKVG